MYVQNLSSAEISRTYWTFSFFFRRKAKLVPKFKLVSHNLFTDLTVGTAGVKKICTDHGWIQPPLILCAFYNTRLVPQLKHFLLFKERSL